jgi:formylglycine-generating enzyme required for sulfatase activity
MLHVSGEYCTEVEQICDDWMEAPTAGGVGRCRRFLPSRCIGKKVKKDFCIDRDEYTKTGESLPMSTTSWKFAKETCEADGKRLCLESEWNFACEGEDMLPYPIGLERDAAKCNYDQLKLLDENGKPRDLRKTSDELGHCVSPFGARNMTGNVDEWVHRDVTWGHWRSALKGGWWMAARNRCRPATTAHDEGYRDFQTGFRCCADSKKE